MRRFSRTLTSQVVLVTAATAVIAVIVTALVAVPVAIRTAGNQARAELVEKSALAVELLAPERAVNRENIVTELRRDDIAIYLIRRGTVDRPGLPPRIVQQVAGGTLVNTRGAVNSKAMWIVGRPLTGVHAGVVLTQPIASGTGAKVLGGVWLALLAGLLGGILAGALLARFIVRPIRQAAAAAGRLSAGDRSVRLAVRSPVEAADQAAAFNQLAAALQTSEGRERDFLLSVSHELRTPLSTIRGYAEALADGVVGAEGAPKAGATMLAEAERLDRPLDVVAVDLVELTRTAAEAWAPRCIPDGPRLLVELAPAPVVVQTDPGRIRQVVDGLCENALRIVPPGAPLILAARPGPYGGIIEVRDGGPGFTDDDLAVAFERGALNQRYKGIRKVGSGLGLALAARLVARLGGVIEAGHAPEGGARFTVELPYATRTMR
jgi:signal transduction histidine kinase